VGDRSADREVSSTTRQSGLRGQRTVSQGRARIAADAMGDKTPYQLTVGELLDETFMDPLGPMPLFEPYPAVFFGPFVDLRLERVQAGDGGGLCRGFQSIVVTSHVPGDRPRSPPEVTKNLLIGHPALPGYGGIVAGVDKPGVFAHHPGGVTREVLTQAKA